MPIDIALRHLLTHFRLPGEAQKIDRVMLVFARRYGECNGISFAGGCDTVYILAFAIIMLNTDLHSRSIKDANRMKLDDFIKNLRGVDAGRDIDRLVSFIHYLLTVSC
jgi:IQ motif/SEC7 domain-containing protein